MKIKEWDGSGLPPVGTVCEYRLDENSTWFKCKIMYVLSGSDHCFVAWCDHLASDQFLTFLSNSYELQLRKIKTPEQIAAEERLHAIEEMIELVAGDSSFNEVMSILYDAGYRKNEADKPLTAEEREVDVMSDFAKIFQSEKYGQLVVIIQGSDDGRPELRIFMKPAGYGVCSSMGLQYEDSDSGWDKCEANFEKIDLAWAERTVQPTLDHLAAMRTQTE